MALVESVIFIVVAVAIIGFGVVSGRAERSVFTPPMAFVLLGVLAGPLALGLVGFDAETPWIHALAELTLVVVLFTDASRIDLGLLRRQHDIPERMLIVGLPLTVVAGTVVAALMFDGLSLWEAAVLAAILSPTDAALGQAVVSNPKVPARIRQALNVESGLNDGIMLPALLILLSCAGAAEGQESAAHWLRFAAAQVILGPLVGIAAGYGGGKLVEQATKSRWMNHAFQQLSALGLALFAFGAAELLGGNGFIAAFAAGLAVGNFCPGICGCLQEFAEAEGQLLTLLIFTVFGVVMVPFAVEHWSVACAVYGLASLTVVRMVPVALGLIGAKLRSHTVLFLGWFGPRGIASILFAFLVLEEMAVAGRETILTVVITTVLLSVLAHGVTAYPGAQWYARRIEGEPRDVAEHAPVTEMPVRLPHRPA